MSKLLKALITATAEDLAEVQAEIAVQRRHLAALLAVEQVLSARLESGEAEPPKKTHPKGEADTAAECPDPTGKGRGRPSLEMMAQRKQIARMLHEEGTMRPLTIAARLGLPEEDDRTIYRLLNYPWFLKGPNGYSVTPQASEALA